MASVTGMQRVIELARTLRERRAKPLKQPLARLTVVHPDSAFLADLDGRLRAYILSEVSVIAIHDTLTLGEQAMSKATTAAASSIDCGAIGQRFPG